MIFKISSMWRLHLNPDTNLIKYLRGCIRSIPCALNEDPDINFQEIREEAATFLMNHSGWWSPVELVWDALSEDYPPAGYLALSWILRLFIIVHHIIPVLKADLIRKSFAEGNIQFIEVLSLRFKRKSRLAARIISWPWCRFMMIINRIWVYEMVYYHQWKSSNGSQINSWKMQAINHRLMIHHPSSCDTDKLESLTSPRKSILPWHHPALKIVVPFCARLRPTKTIRMQSSMKHVADAEGRRSEQCWTRLLITPRWKR